MRSMIAGWNGVIAKLGIKRNRPSKRRHNISRMLRFESLELRQMLAITVDVAFDENDNSITDGDISLRDAIALAPAGETVNFAPSLNGATINLAQILGEIAFSKSLTIDASMLSQGLTIDAGHGGDKMPGTGDGFRIFNIQDFSGTAEVELVGLTLTGGDTPVPTLQFLDVEGGAIRASGASLTIRDCTIRDNGSRHEGGGIAALTGNSTVDAIWTLAA